MRFIYYLIILFLAGRLPAHAQHCTLNGQTPNTARLVCGSSSFYVTTPEYCGITDIPTPCPTGFQYRNRNPNFFRMNCFSAGTLGFTIIPDEAGANYNWQLFDITNYNPVSVLSNPALFVACNWSPEPGETGASSLGTQLAVCANPGELTFSQMPDILAGHAYMLMVSNESASITGYNITFDGGTASITDQVEPHAFSARAVCNGNTIIFRGNKKLQCAGIAANGSDFSISGGGVVVAAAAGPGCSPVTGGDSILITLAAPLPVGNYVLTINQGSDGNTLLDVCNREIPAGETLPFTVTTPQSITMDSIYAPGGCSPDYIELVFDKGINCNSIAPDGSDFLFTGPQAVAIDVLTPGCTSGPTTDKIRLRFASPLLISGTYSVQLKTGTDGNTLIDECGLAVNNNTLSFDVVSPLSAGFTFTTNASCKPDSIRFQHDGNNGANSWQWNFGNGNNSNAQNPAYFFATPGPKTVTLIVSNGLCRDTSTQPVFIPDELKTSFHIPDAICVYDTLPVQNNTTGQVQQWEWRMGDGNIFTTKDPGPFRYRPLGHDMYYTITLIAGSSNCQDTIRKMVLVLDNCLIKVPTAFSPNGDGLNDYLYPTNAVRAAQLQFSVYNRFGQLVFSSRERTGRWDGNFKNQPQAPGVFIWFLQYTDTVTGMPVSEKGTVLLLR